MTDKIETFGMEELQYKILLDRYAHKSTEPVQVDDIVVAIITDSGKDTRQRREVARIDKIESMMAHITTLSGEQFVIPTKHIDKPSELSFEQIAKRVAKGVSQAEKEENRELWQQKFEAIMSDMKFIPAGRILTAAGTDQDLTLMNCYVIPSPKDSRGGIMETLTEMTELMSRGGGVGINVSSLRPKNNYVAGVNGRSSGASSWAAIYSFVTGLIEQGGCFGANERIATDKGLIPALELVERMEAGETFFAQTHQGLRQMTARFRNGQKDLYEVTTARGYKVQITQDHKVATMQNYKIVTVPLRNLQEGDEILLLTNDEINNSYSALDGVKHENGETILSRDTIASIKALGTSEVYDFEVADVHLLSANGIYSSNSRRGALMIILNDWHPDLMRFIQAKKEAGKMENANISVGIGDDFMEAVKSGANWLLKFPDTSYPEYDNAWDGDLQKWQSLGYPVIDYGMPTENASEWDKLTIVPNGFPVPAKIIWDTIVESAWASAEPGLWFRERANKMSNSYYYDSGNLIATNPCGEQSLSGYSACNLGAINLSKFATYGQIDTDKLYETAYVAARFLDDVLDVTPHHLEGTKRQMMNERRIGLGIMGLAELMIRCGVRYGSKESVKFTEKVFETITMAAYQSSIDSAKEKGSFPLFDADKFLNSGFMLQMPESIREGVRTYGIRNVTLTTVAPTGSIGTMANTSTGIEPFFSWVFYRKGRLGMHEQWVDIAKPFIEQNSKLPPYFVSAMELSPEEHVLIQAAAQKWVDSSISKTLNAPNDYTIEETSRLYISLYDLGCKGGTIYRDGSRHEQVLTLEKDDKKNANVPASVSNSSHSSNPEKREILEIGGKTFSVDNVAELSREINKLVIDAAGKETQNKKLLRAKRPTVLSADVIKGETPFGTAFITISKSESGIPFEIFVTIGKSGSDLAAQAESMGRSWSTALQLLPEHQRQDALKILIRQNRGIGGARQHNFGEKRVQSFPDAIAKIIQDYLEERGGTMERRTIDLSGLSFGGQLSFDAIANHIIQSDERLAGYMLAPEEVEASEVSDVASIPYAETCPECHNNTLLRVDGCAKCETCGHSEC